MVNAPDGVVPIFLRGATCEKYGLKIGDGVMDLVEYKMLTKTELMKEIVGLGVMSDFEPAKKAIESSLTDDILLVVDKEQSYGEVFLLCCSEDSKSKFMAKITEREEAIAAQLQAEAEIEQNRLAAEHARLNAVYEDKPISPLPWTSSTSTETEHEIRTLAHRPLREKMVIEITRPKSSLRQKCVLLNRDAEVGGVCEFRTQRDPHFTAIREADMGFQVTPPTVNNDAQTTWYRPINKAIQYSSLRANMMPTTNEGKEELCTTLEKSTFKIENALQQNETLDIFKDSFQIGGDEDLHEGAMADNELRELKNFADPNYSKFKILSAIDWMPRANGMVAVSATRNLSFDQRVAVSGQTTISYILLWDFRQLVRPQILMQSPHDVFTFRFNPSNQNIVAGGCISGQVILWDITESLTNSNKKGSGRSSIPGVVLPPGLDIPEEDDSHEPICIPKHISNVDYGHKKSIADMFWFPPHVQLNYRGQLVGPEYLDDQSYQFVTVAGDGAVLVWDIRYEQIAADALRHIGKSKHVIFEKGTNKEGGILKPQWCPIFKAHLKRMEGVGELSICRAAYNQTSATVVDIGKDKPILQDVRPHIMLATEEGDILSANISGRKADNNTNAKEEDEEDGGGGGDSKEFLRWIAVDHSRPCVALHQSPFFPNILLSVGDWKFNIWKVGEDRPLFTSPHTSSYLTAAAWSPTRPAVLIVACGDGSLLVWDFTDSSYRPSIELKATHTKITSLEFLSSNISRQQLLAVGDESGTLHIFEIPRNITRQVPREEVIMGNFIDRELRRMRFYTEESKGEVSSPRKRNAQNQREINDSSNNTNESNSAEDISREEKEFNDLEMTFLTELGIVDESKAPISSIGKKDIGLSNTRNKG